MDVSAALTLQVRAAQLALGVVVLAVLRGIPMEDVLALLGALLLLLFTIVVVTLRMLACPLDPLHEFPLMMGAVQAAGTRPRRWRRAVHVQRGGNV